jgi:16S rRNA (uracil1498-N3)-methyltransferase
MLYSFLGGNFSDSVQLSERESHHLISVRRGKVGESVTVLNGNGGIATGVIDIADPSRAVIRVLNRQEVQRQGAPLYLAQAMPLGKTMDVIVQKAAELGAVRIIPLVTERSELRLDAERTAKKLEKWKQEAVEAVKQCGNPFMPSLSHPVSLEELCRMTLPKLRLVCSLEANPQPYLATLLDEDIRDGVLIAIGPEGDFTPSEYRLFRETGFLPVTLGPLVLRSDTAATTALAIAAEATRMKLSQSARAFA